MKSTSVFIIQHSEEVSFGVLGTQLWDAGARLEVVRAWSATTDAIERIETVAHALHAGDADVPDAVVVLGGQMHATDDEKYPWLPATRHLIRACVETDHRCLAICLGAQLLTVEMGGRVEMPGSRGPELGLHQLNWCSAHMGEEHAGNILISAEMGYQDHEDAIAEVPDSIAILAKSDTGYPQVLSIAQTIGVQFHPEVTPDLTRMWTTNRHGIDGKKLLRDVTIREDELAVTCQNLTDWLVER